MRCPACNYEDHVYDPEWWGPEPSGFIEIAIAIEGPFFAVVPEGWPSGKSPAPCVKSGNPIKLFACPECGAIRSEKSRL